MEKRLIAKLLVLSTVAVMAFGLLSMAVSMQMGMGHCPVMRASVACPSPTQGAMFFDHHVEGFQSMMLTTLVAFFTTFLVVFAYVRFVPNRVFALRLYSRERWNSDRGPPSPVTESLFWVALHNKCGDIALLRVREKVSI